MTELKTLKDIGKDKKRKCCSVEEDYSNICEKCLKQEAIKWVKNCAINRDKNEGNPSWDFFDGKMHAFIHFFNLTEEDLQ